MSNDPFNIEVGKMTIDNKAVYHVGKSVSTCATFGALYRPVGPPEDDTSGVLFAGFLTT
jgi:hypothetical protein